MARGSVVSIGAKPKVGPQRQPSSPAHAGDPVRRGLSVERECLWNTGSPAFAGDDSRGGGDST
ncbi:hypothetical protein FNJ47_22085 [Bradyrhizobium sp. UFLA 03-164]|uniref:Uncharacterized protein n=1 Tax=Bradyrhizobium uaiense TaxID=2594946 RepID=A0A6P1BIY7_9BRAD|nr:hypothetical protein [Bradyrhizobium uaiense]